MVRVTGFTMLEIIMTLVVIGILTVVLGNRFFRPPPDALLRERTLMISRLAHARAQGVLRGGSCLNLQSTFLNYGSTDTLMTPPAGEGTQVNLTNTVSLAPVGALCFDSLGRLCAESTLVSTGTDSFGRKLCSSTKNITLTLATTTDKATLELNADGYVTTR